MSVFRVIAFLGVLGLVAVGVSGRTVTAQTAAPAANVERGRYIVERVAMCYECHSTRDPQGNIVPGTKFMGGSMPMRPPWSGNWPLQIPRIAGLPGYSDEEATRLLTQGAIKRDGTQLRAPMPRFRMTPQDAADVIAYLRSL
jgi:mono/diheme cytochrome c family protein